MNFLIKNISEYINVFSQLEIDSNSKNIIYLNGELGSGKTSFIKAFMEHKFNYYETTSPTFGLINTYHTQDNEIYHYDLYRIKELNELDDLGLYEFLNKDTIHFIEWPNLIPREIICPKIIINFTLVDVYRLISIENL